MMFAKAVELDVLYDDHVVVLDGKDGIVDHFLEALVITLGEKFHGLGGALGGVEQSFTIRIFSNFGQQVLI
jgi:hypothetical protein